MAKKRSRKAKIKANKKRKTIIPKNSDKKVVSKKMANKLSFTYDPQYIKSDLKKTFVVTVIVLIVLGIISLLYT